MKATAFCPGHITGFFQICEHKEPLRSGSRGAGICTTLGATSTVVSKKGNGDIEIYTNGRKSDAPVTKQALARMILGRDIDLDVETLLDLPISQGFGMSAAGALSAALATAEILDAPMYAALEVAHEAEILHRTGLGDVAALSKGGVTFRRVEGLPPQGRVDRIRADVELVLAVVGPPISTPTVLSDQDARERINLIGKECVEGLEFSPSLANFFRLSREFAMRTGLATKQIEEALTEIDDLGPSSMVMLGNSVFASGDLDEQEKILSKFGQTFRVRVDWKGPRVVEPKK
jgi:pantoate kinase